MNLWIYLQDLSERTKNCRIILEVPQIDHFAYPSHPILQISHLWFIIVLSIALHMIADLENTFNCEIVLILFKQSFEYLS